MTHSNNQNTSPSQLPDTDEEISSILPAESGQTEPGPTTDHGSRKTMLRAERRDELALTDVERRFGSGEVPTSYEVVQRTTTYFGPELLLAANGCNFLLTAPGPDTDLLLWREQSNERGYRTGWDRIAEVRVSIDETPRYEICDQCGNPLRSEEHERLSMLGRCPDGSRS